MKVGDRSLEIIYVGRVSDGEILLRLALAEAAADKSALRRAFALTDRETDVLLWIAAGKSNRDIADILRLESTNREQVPRSDLPQDQRGKSGFRRRQGGARPDGSLGGAADDSSNGYGGKAVFGGNIGERRSTAFRSEPLILM